MCLGKFQRVIDGSRTTNTRVAAAKNTVLTLPQPWQLPHTCSICNPRPGAGDVRGAERRTAGPFSVTPILTYSNTRSCVDDRLKGFGRLPSLRVVSDDLHLSSHDGGFEIAKSHCTFLEGVTYELEYSRITGITIRLYHLKIIVLLVLSYS